MSLYIYRRVLRGHSGPAKVQHTRDRIGQSEVEHINAVPDLRPEQGRTQRLSLRPQSLQSERVFGQDRAENHTDLSGTGQREPGESQPDYSGFPHEQQLDYKDHAQNEHQHL